MGWRKIILTHAIPLLLAIMLIPVMFWAMDKNAPVIYYKIEAEETAVPAGSNLVLRVSGVRAYRCDDTTILQSVTDAQGITFEIPKRTTAVPQDRIGQYVSGTTRVTVPRAASPGPAKYQAMAEYRCNPWQHWIHPLRAVEPIFDFTILPPLEGVSE